jgi:three-Cys-motif partner protein
MKRNHRFGGAWTQEKLERLSKYLSAYMKIFKGHERARWFTTYYVDAFAGTGFRSDSRIDDGPAFFKDEEAAEFQRGSTCIALEAVPPFDRYLFVDRKPDNIEALSELKNQYPDRNVNLICDDANHFIPNWCRETNWERNRAVVFLDPYGTQVDWVTIESIAATRAVDLWLLFPLGQAVNRMLTRHEPNASWANRLDRLFGTETWRSEFY